MTGVPYADRHTEEGDVTYAPFIVAIGMLVGSLTLSFWPPGVAISATIILLGVARWIRESVVENRRLEATTPEDVTGSRGLRFASVHWWGAAWLALVQWVALGAALRVAHAHGVFHPDLPAIPVLPWLGHLTTGVAVVSLLTGIWVFRAGMRRGVQRKGRATAVFLGTAVIHLALLVIQFWSFVDGPFLPDDPGPRSAAVWLFSIHMAFTASTVFGLAILLARIRSGPVAPQRFGIVQAFVLFWWATLLSWFVIYLTIYLRVVQTEFQFI